ncbi:MAG: M20/M25/M40 family metallo-hydrolase [Chloroflexota bacterium]|nr:M20/M25/M40 family metallo-hydrolase [Chloroflexota bacterium]
MIDREWLDASSDAEEAATLTARLVAHRSYPGEEAVVQEAVADWFEEHGLRPEIQAVDGDRSNVLLRIENGPGPTLLLNGHVDTVVAVDGWSSDPWRARRDGDRLYGLGACDMKAGVAAAMLVVRALARRPDLWRGILLFAAVVDEEAYSAGARALIDAGFAADFCLVTESSWARPCLGSVGKVLVRADVTGRAAHASWPAAGINAAVEAARYAARLDDLPLGSHPRLAATRCVLSIHGGNEQYVITVPEHASVLVNRMIVPGETRETVLAEMRALADDLRSPARFDLAVEPPYYPPWETPADHPLARAFAAAYASEAGHPPDWGYAGFGDANLFAGERGIPTVQFGPDGGAFHQADEWIDVPSIGATVRVLLRLTMDLLAPGDVG